MESNGISVLPHLSQSFQLRSDGKCHSYCVLLLPKDRHFSGPFSAADLHPICVVIILNVRSVITSIHYPMEVNFNPVEAALGGIWQVACSKLICRQTPPISLSALTLPMSLFLSSASAFHFHYVCLEEGRLL